MPREQTRGSGVLENALLLRCRDGPRELLFALELLFIIRPGAPDHGAAGAPLLVLLIIRLLFIITALQMALLVCLVPLLQMVCAAGDLLVISACPRAAV